MTLNYMKDVSHIRELFYSYYIIELLILSLYKNGGKTYGKNDEFFDIKHFDECEVLDEQMRFIMNKKIENAKYNFIFKI